MSISAAQLAVRERALQAEPDRLMPYIKAAQTKGVTSRQPKAQAKRWQDEHDYLQKARENLEPMSKMANLSYLGNSLGNENDVETKSGPRQASPLDIPKAEWKSLFEAAKRRLPSYRINYEAKSFQDAHTKTALSEGGFTSGSLPAILDPELTQALPYEPDRLFSHFIQQAAPEASCLSRRRHDRGLRRCRPLPSRVDRQPLSLSVVISQQLTRASQTRERTCCSGHLRIPRRCA